MKRDIKPEEVEEHLRGDRGLASIAERLRCLAGGGQL